MAQAAGYDKYPTGQIPIKYWNKGWSAADRETRRSEGIENFIKGGVAYYEDGQPLTQANPGATRSQAKRK